MSGHLDPRIPQRLRSASRVVGIAAILGGLIAFVGWALDVPLLESFFPGQLPMKPDTIPAFILAGLSLWALQEEKDWASASVRRRLGQLAGGLVAVLGLLAIIQYLSGWTPWLAELLVRNSPGKFPLSATRVSLPAALDFVFIGCGLLLVEAETRAGRRPAEYLGLAAFLGGMFGLLDFVFRPGIVSTGIALNSSVLRCALGWGVLFARPERGFVRVLSSRGLGGSVARRLLPAAIVIPLACGWLVWWGHRAGLYGRELGVMLLVIASIAILEAVTVWTAVALDHADQERRDAIEELHHRARQEAAIASLGQLALSGGELDTLMKEAVSAVAQSLEVEYTKILELLPSGGALLLRAGVGWKAGLIGQATVDASRDSQAGYTLLASEPVLIEDLRMETRFAGPPLLHEHGVVSGLSVVIPGPLRPYGVLGAHTTRQRKFTGDDVHFLQAVAHLLAVAIERQHAEEALRRASAYNRSLIESSLDPLVTIAPDGKITDVNNAAEKVTGLSRQELIGTDFSRYFTEPERAQAGYRQVFRDGWVQDYELAIRHRDGQVTPVLYNASVYRDEAGQVVGVFAAARDVSERKRAERELRLLNRAFRTISECNQVIVRAREERELLYGVCGILVKEGGYRMAWVGYAEQDEARTVRPVASAGFENGYLESVQITWADAERGRGPTGRAIRTGQPAIARSTQHDPDFAPWREEARRRGFASSIGLPLLLDGRTLGALMVYSQFADAFDEQEVRLLTELAHDLAYGVQALRTRAERQRAEVELRELSARLLHLRDDEQRRIARELHDSTGQNLAALGMNLAWIKEQAVSLDPHARDVLAESAEIVNRCTREIRDFSYLLHPPMLDEYGLSSALRWYVEGFARRSGIRVTLEVPEDLRRLPHDEEIALFRVAQECLTNVHRHSGSPTVRIRMAQERELLSLEIADEGRGLQAAGEETAAGGRRIGVGLLGMRERLRNLGGELEIESDGQGTTVRARLPLEEKAA
jgi:PAS domain S-box-containing protein